MQKFAALSGFVSTNAGGDFHPGVRREPRFLTPTRAIELLSLILLISMVQLTISAPLPADHLSPLSVVFSITLHEQSRRRPTGQ